MFVVGPAQRPGVYTLPSQSTLLSAMVAAGGPAPNGSMRKVALRRDGRVVSELDVYEFLVQGDKSKDLQLAAGDVIVFQPAGPRVALNGAHRHAGHLRTEDAAGAAARGAALRRRRAGAGQPEPRAARAHRRRRSRRRPLRRRRSASTRAGLQKPLRDGDVLTLLQISPQFANAVTLQGHVAQPLRYPYTPGMRIRDLIPDREALISPDFYRRKNLLVQVIETTTTPRHRRRMRRRAQRRQPTRRIDERQRSTSSQPALPRRRCRATAAGAPERRGSRRRSTRTRAARQPSGRRAPQRRPSAGRERARRPPTALFDELNWDYAVIERLNTSDLTTQVIPFNLGKAVLQGDEANNIELLPGDVVTVYSQKDMRVPVARQTRLVSLEGEIASPGRLPAAAGRDAARA